MRPKRSFASVLESESGQCACANPLHARHAARARPATDTHPPHTTARPTALTGMILAELPDELLVRVADEFGNPLKLLVAKLPLVSKACRESTYRAQGLLTCVALHEWRVSTVDATVIFMVSWCTQLTSLDLSNCTNITDAAVVAVAVRCTRLTFLTLLGCDQITVAAVPLGPGWRIRSR